MLRTGLVALVVAGSASGQIVRSEFGLDFLRIGDAGNRAPTQAEYFTFLLPNHAPGSVGYEYAIAQKEVSAAQYMEFVEAIKPFWQGDLSELNGSYVIYTGFGDSFADIAQAVSRDYPAGITFWNAARYVNWLHNGKVNEPWAFQTGAYEVPQLGNDPMRFEGDPIERLPGARFWIPSEDEWVKATFWDPAKDGTGGYWPLPHGSDQPLVPGPPGIGETAVGFDDIFDLPRGSYPDTQSPWGLLDVSGGFSEFTDTPFQGTRIFSRGSSNRGYAEDDRFLQIFPWRRELNFLGGGLRVATNIPSPGGIPVMLALGAITVRRR